MSFNNFNLSDDITDALNALNYHTPTDVQRAVIPAALNKKSIIAKSKTGSGKTAAFAIPICQLVDWYENKPQALILTPTRELAAQVKEDFIHIGRYKRIKAAAVYGKQSFAKQQLELKQKCHVTVGTPGRVLDHIQKGTLSLEKISFLVIDEADEMLNMGFIDQVEAIIHALPASGERVTMLFSATLPNDIKVLADQYVQNPIEIEIESGDESLPTIKHALYEVADTEKLSLLHDLTIVENPESCIIFCSTQERVESLFDQLVKLDYSCGKLHGGMYQEDRFGVMNDFKRGEFRYLIATDVAARGIDIDHISHVINYDFPPDKAVYVHRIGRTGRAGNTGIAISFVTPYQIRLLPELEEYLGFKMKFHTPPLKSEVEKHREQFERDMFKQEMKQDKGAELNSQIMKLYFNGGKKKKIRAVDFVGTIAKIDGVTAEDIGIIKIEEQASFVEILHGKGPYVLEKMKNTTVKGKRLKVYEAFEK